MTLPHFRYNPNQEPPFKILIERRDKTRDGHWRPSAFIKLSAELRTSGFLAALPPEDLKSFLLLLTFVTPNGDCAPSLPQLVSALQLSEKKVRIRMERLTETRWHGQPIVLLTRHGNGLEAFMPAPGLVPVQEENAESHQSNQPALTAAPREVIIEHSRRTYGRPRAQVEREVAAQLGHELPQHLPKEATPERKETSHETSHDPQEQLRDELLRVGLQPEQADELLRDFDPMRIQRQLQWLPYRSVRNRAGFLMTAIKDDYQAPRALGRFTPSHPEIITDAGQP